MEINTNFKHSGKVMIGKSNVFSTPQAPSGAMSSLQNKLTTVTHKPSTNDVQNHSTTESQDINTPKAEDKVSSMRNFLNGRM